VKRLSIFLVTVALVAGMVGCDDYTPSEDLEIRDWYDLDDVRNNLGGHHTLMNDLDSTTIGYDELASSTANGGKGWKPIGWGAWEATPIGIRERGEVFKGSFDGQGYEIRDLHINSQGQVGLFGFVSKGGIITEGGIIKNITLINATVTTGEDSGGQLGLSEDTVRCLDVASAGGVGALAGYNGGTVSNCYAMGNITGDSGVGGLVGHNDGTVSKCYATGTVTGSSSVGGLVGGSTGTVSESYSSTNVTGTGEVGGLVGGSGGTVSNCYATGSVSGNSHVGGLVGYSEGAVSNSYYDYGEVLINGENVITIGALSSEDFDQWLANDKFLDVNERLSKANGCYLINDVSDFKQLLAFGQDNSLKFRLKRDLDLGDQPNFYIPYLAGEFDGNGHKISNLSFSFDFVCNVGLFGYLAPGGKVSGLGVENVNITAPSNVGGLVGYNREGTVSNCYATGSVTGNGSIGGLAGQNYGTVSNSYSIGSVIGSSSVGGLLGHNMGTVRNSYSTGTVTGDGYVGGLAGWNGFWGYVGTVSNCYSTADVTGDSWVGGLVGYNVRGCTVSKSYSTGSVSGTWGTGGLVGGSVGTVSNSYATGSVIGNSSVGGLVGFNGIDGSVTNSYSTGSMTGDEHVGGLVGHDMGTVSNSFWDIETSGQSNSAGGTGKAMAEMQDIATFSGAGWDIIAVAPGETNNAYTWNIIEGQTYPFLSWGPQK